LTRRLSFRKRKGWSVSTRALRHFKKEERNWGTEDSPMTLSNRILNYNKRRRERKGQLPPGSLVVEGGRRGRDRRTQWGPNQKQ